MISKEENILLNAEKLFAEKGFDATSTREISKAANTNVSMISYYFGSKEKLFEKLFELRINEGKNFAKEIIEREDLNEWGKISEILDNYTKRVRHLKDFYAILQTEQLTNKNPQIINFLKNSKLGYVKVYEKLIDEGYQNKVFTKKPNIALLHSTITGTMFYAMNGLPMYKEHFNIQENDKDFDQEYYENLNQHIKQILKNLLGYEEKK